MAMTDEEMERLRRWAEERPPHVDMLGWFCEPGPMIEPTMIPYPEPMSDEDRARLARWFRDGPRHPPIDWYGLGSHRSPPMGDGLPRTEFQLDFDNSWYGSETMAGAARTAPATEAHWAISRWDDLWYEVHFVPEDCNDPPRHVASVGSRDEALVWYAEHGEPGSTLGYIEPQEEADRWRSG